MEQKSIKKNFILNATLSALNVIFPLLTFPYVTRVLGPDNLGKIRFVSSFVQYFVLFSQLGLPTLGVREVAKVRDDKAKLTKLVQELLIINLIVSAIAYTILFFCFLTVDKVIDNKALIVVFSFNIFFNAIGIEWMYKGLEEYGYITVRSVLFKLLSVAAIFLFIHSESDNLIYGIILVLATSGSYLCNFVHARKYVSLKYVGGYEFKRHIKNALIFLGMSAATTIYTNLDSIMLGFMTTDTEVGYYDTAVRVKSVLITLITSLGAVLLPRASYYIERGLMDEFKRITTKALDFVWCISLPFMLYCMIFAYPIIMVLGDVEYEPSVPAMIVISPTIFLIGMSNIFGIQMLVPMGLEKRLLVAEIAGAVVDLVLNAIYIPKMGATGASLGTLVAEIVVLVLAIVALGKHAILGFRGVSYVKIVSGLVLASIVSYPVLPLNIGSLYKVLLSGSIFFSVYGIVLLITKEKMMVEAFGIIKRKVKR